MALNSELKKEDKWAVEARIYDINFKAKKYRNREKEDERRQRRNEAPVFET